MSAAGKHGRGAGSGGDIKSMSRRFALTLAIAALLGLAIAPSAGARSLLAPTAACANQTDLGAPVVVQERAMRCMTDFARRHAGLANLGHAFVLDRSSEDKSRDILRCNSFSHYACGRGFTYWMQRVGYLPARCWSAGENIAWGTGRLGTVRSIFKRLAALARAPREHPRPLSPARRRPAGRPPRRLPRRPRLDPALRHPLLTLVRFTLPQHGQTYERPVGSPPCPKPFTCPTATAISPLS